MKATARKSHFARILTVLVVVLLVLAAGLAAVRLIGGQPLGIRHWVDVQVWHARSFVAALSHSPDVKALSQGKVTNVVFLHHSVGDNLLEQTDLRDQLGQAGLSLWDHDYNYYGLTGADGQSSGYNYWIPDDNTDPAGLARLFSQRVFDLPLNGISGLMQHEAIVFKSCFTGNVLLSDADVTAVKGYYEAVHRFIVGHPEKLFVLLTTPPLNSAEADAAMAMRARQVAEWLLSEDFRRGQANLYVFDLYGQLADNDPASANYGTLRAAYRDGSDNHPNRAANQALAPLLADFIVQSVEAFRTAQD